jgi:hypothetical protein
MGRIAVIWTSVWRLSRSSVDGVLDVGCGTGAFASPQRGFARCCPSALAGRTGQSYRSHPGGLDPRREQLTSRNPARFPSTVGLGLLKGCTSPQTRLRDPASPGPTRCRRRLADRICRGRRRQIGIAAWRFRTDEWRHAGEQGTDDQGWVRRVQLWGGTREGSSGWAAGSGRAATVKEAGSMGKR